MAEAWLIAQEPYLLSQELGVSINLIISAVYTIKKYLISRSFQLTIDEVENLIKKHEAFEKSAAAQEERFSALERLTTVNERISLKKQKHFVGL